MTAFPFQARFELPALVWNQHDDSDAYFRIGDDWRCRDAHLDELTNTGSLIAEWVRLIAGRRSNGTYSRSVESAITLDTLSLGIDHRWARYLPGRFAEIVKAEPALAAWAWGTEGAAALADPAFLRRHLGDVKGKHPRSLWPGRSWECLEWLVSGWYEIARHPRILRIWIDGTASKLKDALGFLNDVGFTPTDELLALVARAMNSRGESGFTKHFNAWRRNDPDAHAAEGDPLRLLRAYYDDEDGYDHDDRDDIIVARFGEELAELEDLDGDELNWDAPVVRYDGTIPEWRTAINWRML